MTQLDALTAVRELFHVCYWLARTYAKGAKPADGVLFDQKLLPTSSPVSVRTVGQLQELAESVAEKDAKLSALLTGKADVDAELEKLRAEIAAIKLQNAATPDQHDYSEAATRDFIIDLLLKEAGWPLTTAGHDTDQKVFVVDDEGQIAEVLSIGLREAEFDVETFYDARSALLRASACPPGILVSDIVMPGMDGIALAEALREQNPNCKIIFISGNPEWKTREDWRGDGLDGFVLLPKPFAFSQLLSLIKSHEDLVTERCATSPR
jgi:CheY-like chemotaxis protein